MRSKDIGKFVPMSSPASPDLNDEISSTEESINKVSKLIKELNGNAFSVKSEVHKSIGDQFDLLRQREIQLLRQVDALVSHQSALLQLKLAKLYQRLTNLKTTGFEPPSDLSELISTRLICYQPLKEKDLLAAITSFGRFEAQGTPSNVLLLPEEEEYGDGDQHILHKEIQDDCFSKIKMSFPKLSGQTKDWLLSTDFAEAKIEDYELSTASSSRDDSIELLSYSEVDNIQAWLQLTPKPVLSPCGCQDKGDVEIENLDSLTCIPMPSNGSHHTGEPITVSVPTVKVVCRSNGPNKCSSFEDCICPESCLVSNLKDQLKGYHGGSDFQKQDCINEVIKEAYIKRNEPKRWLMEVKTRPKEVTVSSSQKWLSEMSNASSIGSEESKWLLVETKKAEKVQYNQDQKQWLKSFQSKEVDRTLSKHISTPKFSPDQDWLFKGTTKCLNKNSTMRQMFKMYFAPFETKSWLLKEDSQCAIKNWLVKC